MNDSFEQMWLLHKNQIYRILLSLCQDIDLAEDCLQDTYLSARQGFASYRGEGERAWLSTIARNAFYNHARKRAFTHEESLETADEHADTSLNIGSDTYLQLLLIREAIAQLEPDLQKALIMKHFGGFDYEEIAEQLLCTPTAAKLRVWRAMEKLRSRLGEQVENDHFCPQLRGPKILDWLYGVLPKNESAEIESHISLCQACRRRLHEVRQLGGVLDKAEGDRRILTLIDLDADGSTTRYVWVKHINERLDIKPDFRWFLRPGWTLEYLALQGEPVDFRFLEMNRTDMEPGTRRFQGMLPRPVARGEMIDAMFIVKTPLQTEWSAEPLGNDVFHYHHKHTPFPEHNAAFVITIRLPKDARLIKADPKPQKTTIRNGLTSLTWRVITEIVDDRFPLGPWQFEADLEYVLTQF